jgi:hypothetical protein
VLQPPDFFDGAMPLTYVLIRILRALLAVHREEIYDRVQAEKAQLTTR